MSRSILKRSLIAETHPASTVSEAYRSLRTNIEFASPGRSIENHRGYFRLARRREKHGLRPISR